MKKNEQHGGAAFPCAGGYTPINEGMTLRDYFAAQVLMGMHARDAHDPGLETPGMRAALAYIDADAMLRERAK